MALYFYLWKYNVCRGKVNTGKASVCQVLTTRYHVCFPIFPQYRHCIHEADFSQSYLH